MPSSLLTRLVGWLSLPALAGCSFFQRLAPYQTERFALTAGPCAAEGYPMEAQDGYFTTSDGKSFVVSPKLVEGDWGLSHTSYVSGDGTAPAPDSLVLRWYSYAEDQFYEGQWAMTQRRLHELLKQRFWEPDVQRYSPYDQLTVCMLPAGAVVVWLTGPNQVLVDRYQARAVDFDFRRFNPAANRARLVQQERAALPPAVQAQLAAGPLSARQWDEYLRRYPWRLALNQPLHLTDAGVTYFSAERDHYSQDSAVATQIGPLLAATPKAVPRSLGVEGTLPDGRRRYLKVKGFDEAETLAAFRQLHAAHPDAPLTLRLETDPDLTQGRLVLESAGQRLPLTRSPLSIYTPSDND